MAGIRYFAAKSAANLRNNRSTSSPRSRKGGIWIGTVFKVEIISKLKRPYVRYTRADEKNVLKADCLIIDCFGLLSSIYRYGEIAYIFDFFFGDGRGQQRQVQTQPRVGFGSGLWYVWLFL